MTEIERVVLDPDLVVTALQQKYVESMPGEPAIRVDGDGRTELLANENGFTQPESGVALRPERFVGDLDLPDPDAELDDEEIEKLAERLGSEVRPELKEEVDLNADHEGDERIVPVEYDDSDP
ncbi:hypothetical protein [Halococcus thailandensis]|uniref:Uncharacterized protein n=1 Tax=Halococcus thailandensis JCM 13552 TaxID=1227457 RepID=M0MXW1_9EURY|nr:hypothetical protein [Halococcus thailandensis]EMA50547.1 hypothetical protein C451_16310 [Halococcus thailandensis JCM 13552]